MISTLVGLTTVLAATPDTAESSSRTMTRIPHFARMYGVTCKQCHVAPPKLNRFGEEFFARGYAMPNLTARRTVPISVWVSGRSDALPVPANARDNLAAYLNRVELISGGKVIAPWLSYFVEWRPVSQEARGDGTLRDRGGRFEDLFVVAAKRNTEITVGQFRQIAQVDASRRLGLSEPLVLSASLAGTGGGSGRERSLRGFSPSGRAPAVRAAWIQPLGGGWRWTTAAAVSAPGEFSIPLNDEARIEASNEIEWRRKGFLVESFARRRLASVGGHVFYDNSRRYLAQAITTGSRSALHWTAIGGAAKAGDLLAGRWSVEAEYLPRYFVGLGGRVEDRAADNADVAVLPYVNVHFPGTRYTVRLTVERRFQGSRSATLVELGTIF